MARSARLLAVVGLLAGLLSIVPDTHADQLSVFAERCGYSHRLPDDPIVFPAQPGASHSHDFSANRTTNAASTLASMQGQATTCPNQGDTAGYWVPTLYMNGVAQAPVGFITYYFAPVASPGPPPAGLKVVAGSASATVPQSTDVIRWHCFGGFGGPSISAVVPNCPQSNPLTAEVRFPACWDGVNLDSTDHKSHMAYESPKIVGATCPADHPVALPKVVFALRYAAWGDPANLSFASGSINSLHGDFFQTWNQAALDERVNNCLQPGQACP